MVRREGRTIRAWSRSTVDDGGSVAVQGVGRGVEGVAEVVGEAGLSTGEGGSFEA